MKAQHTLKFWAKFVLTHSISGVAFERLERSRRWRRYRKTGIVFVHVPKAAGSSITAVLYGGRLGHHSAAQLMTECPDDWAALEKFAVVRDPVSRFLSAYAFALAGGTKEGAIRWRSEYEEPAYRDANVFVREYLVQGGIFEKDLIFWPQSHFVCDSRGHPVADLQLFTTRQFQAVIEFLAARGHAAPLRLNRSTPPAGLNLNLSADTLHLLHVHYAADFEWFRRLEAA